MPSQKPVFRTRETSVAGSQKPERHSLDAVMQILGIDHADPDIRRMFTETVTESLCKMTPEKLAVAIKTIADVNDWHSEAPANVAEPSVSQLQAERISFAPPSICLPESEVAREKSKRVNRERQRTQQEARNQLLNSGGFSAPTPIVLAERDK